MSAKVPERFNSGIMALEYGWAKSTNYVEKEEAGLKWQASYLWSRPGNGTAKNLIILKKC